MNARLTLVTLAALGVCPLSLQAASPSAVKRNAVASVDKHADELTGVSDKVWGYAETALREYN